MIQINLNPDNNKYQKKVAKPSWIMSQVEIPDVIKKHGSSIYRGLIVVVLCFILGSLISQVVRSVANFEPPWKTNQRNINQQIQNSDAPTATIVLADGRVRSIYIPPEVTVSSGGDSVILTGPRDVIARLHRQAWELD